MLRGTSRFEDLRKRMHLPMDEPLSSRGVLKRDPALKPAATANERDRETHRLRDALYGRSGQSPYASLRPANSQMTTRRAVAARRTSARDVPSSVRTSNGLNL